MSLDHFRWSISRDANVEEVSALSPWEMVMGRRS